VCSWLRSHFRRAAEPHQTQYEAQIEAADIALEYVSTRTGGLDWRSPFGLLSQGTPDLRVEWKHGSASGDTQVEDVCT